MFFVHATLLAPPCWVSMEKTKNLSLRRTPSVQRGGDDIRESFLAVWRNGEACGLAKVELTPKRLRMRLQVERSDDSSET